MELDREVDELEPEEARAAPGERVQSAADGDGRADDWDTLPRFAGFKSGDAEARELFCRHYEPLIQRFLRAHPLLGWLERHGWTGEDVLHEVYLAFLTDAPRRFTYRGKGSMEVWLKVLAQRTMIDLYRRATSRKRGDGETDVPLGAEHEERARQLPGRTPLASASSWLRLEETLERAAQLLGPQELFIWWESDVTEPAASSLELGRILGRTDSSVRSMLYRARAKLMDELEP